MKKRIFKVFILIMMLILFTPALFTLLGIKVQPVNEKKINLNFKRNFPLKADLFKAYSYLKTNLFKTDPIPGKVVSTKFDEWKFVGNEFNGAFSGSKGLVTFSKKELDILKSELIKRKQWLDEQGIKYYIAVAPNKLSYYGEFIPIKQKKNNTKLQQLDSLCKIVNVNFIDLGSNYPKDKKLRLYHKTDTHWNDYGAFFANKSTFESLKRDFKDANFINFELEDMILSTTNEPIGDLNGLLMLKKNEAFIHLDFKDKMPSIALEKKLNVPDNYKKDPHQYENRYRNDSVKNNLKLLVFNDSFFVYYSKYINRNFKNTVFIWDYAFDKKLIANEKPDILYQEILERKLDFLIEDK